MTKSRGRATPASPRRAVPPRPGSNGRKPLRKPAPAPAISNRRGRQVALFTAISVVVIGGVVALAATRGSSTAGYDTSPQSFVLPALAGPGKVSLATFKGKPVVVNFFASWCTQCAGELPVFDADARATQGKVAFVEINAEETGNGPAFAQRYALSSSVSAVARDVGGGQGDGLYQALGGNGSMPMTAFYGADGKLITTHIGAFDSASLGAALQQLYGITAPA